LAFINLVQILSSGSFWQIKVCEVRVSSIDHPIEVFISYAHKDEDLRLELIDHLSNLQRQGVIACWHDRLIVAGQEWAGEIDEQMNSAQIVLLLISASFMASNYCNHIEMQQAMARHETSETIVIPIILRACDWQGAPFSYIQSLPKDAKPITSWANRDEAWTNVIQGIRRAIERLYLRYKSQDTPKSTNRALARPLLPYLCNRSEQELALGIGLRRHQQGSHRRPVVCLIHGDELEAHGDFLERLRLRTLPKLLDLEAKQLSVRELPLSLPRRVRMPQVFWQLLGDALLLNSAATPEDIMLEILRPEEPLIISLHLLTEVFEESDETLLLRFFEFWNQWPDLPAGRTLIHCVCLKYERCDNSGLFDFKKRRRRRLNDRLRRLVESLDFTAHPQLTAIVLPELRAIPRSDVEAWSRYEQVRKWCRIHEREIRAMYQRPDLCNHDGHIPMELLAEELQKLISRHFSL
jgi:hypothetical protein